MSGEPRPRSARKLGLLASLYLSQGVPFGFFTQALPVVLRQAGRSLPEIGLTWLLALPWALKFLWAPLVDRWYVARFGRRRSWIVPLQVTAVLTMIGLAFVDSATGVRALVIGFLLANLLAATQDVAVDGLAVELLTHEERGVGNGIQVAAYRLGMILSGGVLLIFYERLSWAGTFLAMAAMLALATLPILAYREPTAAPRPRAGPGIRASLAGFCARRGALGWLLFIVAYKAGDAFGAGMLRPFLVDIGLSMADIGWLLGTAGFTSGLIGALLGGALVNVLGRLRALAVFGVFQAVAVASYAIVALGWNAPWIVWTTCVADHLAGGMATAALFTLMMDACRRDHEGSDYTLQASLVVLSTGTVSALSGVAAEALGYTLHFCLGALVSGAAALALVPVIRAGGFRLLDAAPDTALDTQPDTGDR